MTEKEMTNLGFTFVKVYDHDQFRTIRYKKGVLQVEFTYDEDGLESTTLTIEEVNSIETTKEKLNKLDEILN